MKTAFHFESILPYIVISILMFSCLPRENKTPAASSGNERENIVVFIGEMYYLPETEEFYTPLFFNPDFDEESSDALISRFDSIVYEKNRIARKRIPLSEAKIAFMLSGLDSLFIYDMHHVFVSKATFIRVEYFQNGIADKFIAVYKAGKLRTDPAEQYYCTNDLLPEFYVPGFSYRRVNDQSLNKFIIHRLKRDQQINWDITNVEVLPGQTTYSIVNSSSESFITEFNNSVFNVVINMNRGYRVENILPLPFEFNQHPLMFIRYYKHNDPSLQTSLAAFAEYQEYKLLSRNRLEIKKIETGVRIKFQ